MRRTASLEATPFSRRSPRGDRAHRKATRLQSLQEHSLLCSVESWNESRKRLFTIASATSGKPFLSYPFMIDDSS